MATPTDTFQLLHYNMVHGMLRLFRVCLHVFNIHCYLTAHETFKRGYEIIMSNLQTPPRDDLKNFLGYCEAWAVSIEGHHETEVSGVFSCPASVLSCVMRIAH